jgi:ketosteroid isomerase-like protein
VSNKEIIQEIYDAFASARWDRVLELCDPECVITQDDALPWGGRHEGFDGVANFGLALAGTIDSAAAEFYIDTPAMLDALGRAPA